MLSGGFESGLDVARLVLGRQRDRLIGNCESVGQATDRSVWDGQPRPQFGGQFSLRFRPSDDRSIGVAELGVLGRPIFDSPIGYRGWSAQREHGLADRRRKQFHKPLRVIERARAFHSVAQDDQGLVKFRQTALLRFDCQSPQCGWRRKRAFGFHNPAATAAFRASRSRSLSASYQISSCGSVVARSYVANKVA